MAMMLVMDSTLEHGNQCKDVFSLSFLFVVFLLRDFCFAFFLVVWGIFFHLVVLFIHFCCAVVSDVLSTMCRQR